MTNSDGERERETETRQTWLTQWGWQCGLRGGKVILPRMQEWGIMQQVKEMHYIIIHRRLWHDRKRAACYSAHSFHPVAFCSLSRSLPTLCNSAPARCYWSFKKQIFKIFSKQQCSSVTSEVYGKPLKSLMIIPEISNTGLKDIFIHWFNLLLFLADQLFRDYAIL